MQLSTFLKVLLVFTFAGPAAAAQSAPLTLSSAVSIALEKNPTKKLAAADLASASAGVDLARSGFMPRISFSETATRGNDPVYAFGTRLRQGRFSAGDFALDRLNYPDPISNFSSRIGGEWNLFNSFQSRYQFRSARASRDAAQQQLSRADQEIIFKVVRAYYGALFAKRYLDVAQQSLASANAVVESSSAKVQAGTAVEADALAAKVTFATRQQELIRAKGDLDISYAQLESALGARLPSGQLLADALEDRTFPQAQLEDAEAHALKQRPDLQAVTLLLNAQKDSVRAARAALGPRLNAFGSWQADNSSFASNGSSSWMTGLELRIDLFAREKNSKLAIERAGVSRAEAVQQMTGDRITLDVRRAFYEHDAARQMLVVARGSTSQADETLRIIRDRYDSGLVPVTELLRAEDAARLAHTDYWQAVYSQAISYASLQLAIGELNTQSPVVTQ